MNFVSMDYFAMVVQERSFTRAAERLHITQQTLSAHIANLEKEVGSRLFIRSVPLELTYAGQVFWQYAIDFQRKRRMLDQEMGDIAKDQRGLLRIGIASTRGRSIMPALIHTFRQNHPLVSVKLVEAANDQLRQYLCDGEVDLAIANFPSVIPGMEVQDFYQENIVLLIAHSLLERLYGPGASDVVDRVKREGLAALQDCPFLLNSPQDIAGRVGRSALTQAEIIPYAAVESSNIETLLKLCLQGEGACFCPQNLMEAVLTPDEISQFALFNLGADGQYTIRLAYLKQKHCWSILSDFITMALKSTHIIIERRHFSLMGHSANP